jgi:putative DNA primase/helicase
MLEGFMAWQRDGLQAPEEVRRATREYRSDMDLTSQFLQDCCVLENGASATARELYEEYVEWCESNGQRPISQLALGQRLKAKGLQQTRTNRARGWAGIKLASEGDRLALGN